MSHHYYCASKNPTLSPPSHQLPQPKTAAVNAVYIISILYISHHESIHIYKQNDKL